MCEESQRKKDIHIQLADMKYIDSCIDILQNFDLGKAYFSDHKKTTNMLTYAVGQENIYVALDENEKCLGFIYYMTNGVFGSYPYLHIVAVKEEYRNYGIGKQLMKFFEDNAQLFHHTHAVFSYKEGTIGRRYDPETGTGFWGFE